MLHLFNVFRENKDSDNCAKVLEEECNKMFGIQSLNDEHDYNLVTMNSLNIHSTNDDCTSHDENVSYKHVNFCGVHRVCKYSPNREDRFCKRHKYLLLSYKPLHLEAQQRLQEEGCVVDIELFSGAVVGEVSA